MKPVRFFIVCMMILSIFLPAALTAGGSREQVSPEEAEKLNPGAQNPVLTRTVTKPGPPDYTIGKNGGTWVTTINSDPKSFNEIIANKDGESSSVIAPLLGTLADYDWYKKEWIPELTSFEIKPDERNNTMDVVFTLRDDLYWTTADGRTRIKVTSDDVVFWYDEVVGDETLQDSGYYQQFMTMPDGTEKRITIEKLDDRRFVLHYPIIIASPILASNMNFGPRYLYEPAKRRGGVEAMLNLLAVNTPVTSIPSIGPYHLVEYTPGVRLVYKRNPNYYKKDKAGNRLPYIETIITRIVPDRNTEYLLFRDGTKDSYTSRPEDLNDLITAVNPNYTVYNAGESPGSSFISFNQNPNTVKGPKFEWFTKKEFRQAMSSLLNRERIASQIYRGLAIPATGIFPKQNPFYDPAIRLAYTYNPQKAIELLASIGIRRGNDGIMRDDKGNAIVFDLILGAENNVAIDMANIFADELKQVGITLNVRPLDFQKIVENLSSTYTWDAVMIALGASAFPEQGSNVWPSSGNLHLWYPLQKQPATDWERRLDKLYNDGQYTLNQVERKRIYDEFQTILLEQLPLMYIVHPFAFTAIRNKWDNIWVDLIDQPDLLYVFLKN